MGSPKTVEIPPAAKAPGMAVPPPPADTTGAVAMQPPSGANALPDPSTLFDEFTPATPAATQNAQPDPSTLFDEFPAPEKKPKTKPTVTTTKKPPPGIPAPAPGTMPGQAPANPPLLQAYMNAGQFAGQVGQNVIGGLQTAGRGLQQAWQHPMQAIPSAALGAAGGFVGVPEDIYNAASGALGKQLGLEPNEVARIRAREEIEHGKLSRKLTGEGTKDATPDVMQSADFGGGMLFPLGPIGSGAGKLTKIIGEGSLAHGAAHGALMGAGFGATSSLSQDVLHNRPQSGKDALHAAAVGAGTGGLVGAAASAPGAVIKNRARAEGKTETKPGETSENPLEQKGENFGVKLNVNGKVIDKKFDSIVGAANHAIDNPEHADTIQAAIQEHLQAKEKQKDTSLEAGAGVETRPVSGPGDALKNEHSGLTMPRALSGAKPAYGNAFRKLDFADDLDKALYIVKNKTEKSRAEDAYMTWIRDNTKWSDEEIDLAAKRVHDAMRINNRFVTRDTSGKVGTITIPAGARDYGILRLKKEAGTEAPLTEEAPSQPSQPVEAPKTYKEALDRVKNASQDTIHDVMAEAKKLKPEKTGAEAYDKKINDDLNQAYMHYEGRQLAEQAKAKPPIPGMGLARRGMDAEASRAGEPPPAPINHNAAEPVKELPPDHPGYLNQQELKQFPNAFKPILGSGESTTYGATQSLHPQELTDTRLDEIIEHLNTEKQLKSNTKTARDNAQKDLETIQQEKLRRETRKKLGHPQDWPQNEHLEPGLPQEQLQAKLQEHRNQAIHHPETLDGEAMQIWGEAEKEASKRELQSRTKPEEMSTQELRQEKYELHLRAKHAEETMHGTAWQRMQALDRELENRKVAPTEEPPQDVFAALDRGPRYTSEKTKGGYHIWDTQPEDGSDRALHRFTKESEATVNKLVDKLNSKGAPLRAKTAETAAKLDRVLPSDKAADELLSESDPVKLQDRIAKLLNPKGPTVSMAAFPGVRATPGLGRKVGTTSIGEDIKRMFSPKEDSPPSARVEAGQVAGHLAWLRGAKRFTNDLVEDMTGLDKVVDRMLFFRGTLDHVEDFSKATGSSLHDDIWKEGIAKEIQASWGLKKFMPGDLPAIRNSERLSRQAIISGEEGLDRFDPQQRLFLADRAERRNDLADRIAQEIEQYREDEGENASDLWLHHLEETQRAFEGQHKPLSPIEKVVSKMYQGMYDYIFRWNPAFQALLLHDPIIAGSSRVGVKRVAAATKALNDREIGEYMEGLALEDPYEQVRQEINADTGESTAPKKTRLGKLHQEITKPRDFTIAGRQINTAQDLGVGRYNNRVMMAAGFLDYGDAHYNGNGMNFLRDLATGKVSDEIQMDALVHALRITDDTLGTGALGLNKNAIASSPMLKGFSQFSSQMLRVTRLKAKYLASGDYGKLATMYGVTALLGGSAAIDKELKTAMKMTGTSWLLAPVEEMLDTYGNLPAHLLGRDLSEKIHMQIMTYGTNGLAEDFKQMVDALEKHKWDKAGWAAAMFVLPRIMGIGTGTVKHAGDVAKNMAAGKKDYQPRTHGLFRDLDKPLGGKVTKPYGPVEGLLDMTTPTQPADVADIQRQRRAKAEGKLGG